MLKTAFLGYWRRHRFMYQKATRILRIVAVILVLEGRYGKKGVSVKNEDRHTCGSSNSFPNSKKEKESHLCLRFPESQPSNLCLLS